MLGDQLMMEKNDSDVLGQFKKMLNRAFNRASNPGGSAPDGLPLPLTWGVATVALKKEAAARIKGDKRKDWTHE